MSDAKPHITDHAIVRYLERKEGVDVKALRSVIAKRVAKGVELGADRVHHDGITYQLTGHVVTTCVEKNKPSVHTGMAKGKRGFIDDET